CVFFFSSRRRHTRSYGDWSSDVCSSDPETLTLQDNVARTIAEQIRINLNAQERATLTHGKVVDPRAYEAYLKGRYFWNKRTGDRSEERREGKGSGCRRWRDEEKRNRKVM